MDGAGRGVIWVYLSNDIRVAFWRGKTSAALFPFSELHNSWLLLIIGFYDCAVSGTMRGISSGRPTGGASANAAFMRIACSLPALIPALIEQLYMCSWFMRALSSSRCYDFPSQNAVYSRNIFIVLLDDSKINVRTCSGRWSDFCF